MKNTFKTWKKWWSVFRKLFYVWRNRSVVLCRPTLECLGYRIDETGINPVEARVKAIQEAPEPTDVTELNVYSGLLNFNGKFLVNKVWATVSVTS